MSAAVEHAGRTDAGLTALAVAAIGAALVLQPDGMAAPLVAAAILIILTASHLGFSVRLASLGLLALVIGLDNPSELPAAGNWQSPLTPLATLLFANLNKTLGVDALRFPLLDLLIFGLALAASRHPSAAPAPRPLAVLLLLSLLGLAGLELWGLWDDGDFRNSLYQVQQLAAVPVLAYAFHRSLDVRRDLVIVAGVLLAAFALKLGMGLYFYEHVCRPQNWRPPYTNTHSDSVLFVVALSMVAAFALHRRTLGALFFGLAASLPILVALYINNRRLAWVELACVAVVLFAAAPPSRAKGVAMRGMLAMVPVLALYVAAGWSTPRGIFRPVGMVRSVVISDEDRSTGTRDIENFNLIWTLKRNPLFGSGFGHEYIEKVRADDISAIFPQYRYVPHNSVLGLWAFGGLAGFSLVWLPLVLASYLAFRTLALARSSLARTAASAVLATLAAYTVQGYGDMGLQSWPATVLLALALAICGQLAVDCGAMQADLPLFGRSRRIA